MVKCLLLVFMAEERVSFPASLWFETSTWRGINQFVANKLFGFGQLWKEKNVAKGKHVSVTPTAILLPKDIFADSCAFFSLLYCWFPVRRAFLATGDLSHHSVMSVCCSVNCSLPEPRSDHDSCAHGLTTRDTMLPSAHHFSYVCMMTTCLSLQPRTTWGRRPSPPLQFHLQRILQVEASETLRVPLLSCNHPQCTSWYCLLARIFSYVHAFFLILSVHFVLNFFTTKLRDTAKRKKKKITQKQKKTPEILHICCKCL